MQPVPYLFFQDTCAEAIRFYADVFGAPEPDIMTFDRPPRRSCSTCPASIPTPSCTPR